MNILLLGHYSESFLNQLRGFKFNIAHILNKNEIEAEQHIRNAEVVVVRSPHKISDLMIESSNNLRYIIRAGSGIDNISKKYVDKNIKLILCSQNHRAVAELIIGCVFNLYRNISKADQSVKTGLWLKNELVGYEVKNKKIGILGFGKIGRELGLISRALGMNVYCYDRSFFENEEKLRIGNEINVLVEKAYENIFKDCDIVVNCLPLTPTTSGLIDKSMLELLKPNAVFLNFGRGGTVVTKDLFQVLKNKKIHGAALDVYEVEPPTNNPILNLDNVILTPHIGAQTLETRINIEKEILKNLFEMKLSV
ncbi:D-isomer specific 2-hydroxyacid dehydrogenase family protein [Oceanobacillus sp. CFH 90083]|uniref:NAD(P)-dependent oxidoreductase n=1 Tax=Oceanobacillus sp. CFH 90083 TaxID=2592336 RepID=UPI001883623C|nr:NAD(P)-dependent oxidoreductase [Oceanobacillus sp. CFH 90083]